MKRHVIAGVVVLCLPLLASGASVGSLPRAPGPHGSSSFPFTIINATHPATAGVMTTASLVWEGPGCANAYRVKFFRPSNTVPQQFFVHAERGPFPATSGVNIVTLSPPVTLQDGDLVGVTQLGGNACGGVVLGEGKLSDLNFTSLSDTAAGAALPAITINRGHVVGVRAASDPNAPQAYITVVGSTQGAFGSVFRTAMQLTNPWDFPITGKLVFHPQGRSAQPSDPALNYTVFAGASIAIDDLVAELFLTGLGSVDVVSQAPLPDIQTRVFDDDGASGTSGFTQEALTANDALRAGQHAGISIPGDPVNVRLNIGVRTLDAGATITVTVTSGDGIVLRTLTRPYPPNHFEQVTAAAFADLPASSLVPNGRIEIAVIDGSLLAYGAITDNRTNDPSIRFFSLR